MCGIAGWLGPAGPDPRDRQSRLLTHRGPDDEGRQDGPGWGLLFRRLSILDLSAAGAQPMSTPDGRFHLVFNGEIYNHEELAAELRAGGVRLRGHADSEVLLHLLARHGADALPRLNGMFALALVDSRERTFLLARDRMGKKPLYLSRVGGALRFSSELKGLLAWPDARRELDPDALADYLLHGYVTGGASILAGCAPLPPAHVLRGSLDDPGAATLRPYWSLDLSEDPGGGPLGDAALEELAWLLEDAVRLRLRSDVPVGVFLSGGIDSGLVAETAGRAAAAAGTAAPLALTVGFADPELDESAEAAAVAAAAGLPHRVVPGRPARAQDVDRLAWFYDEPFADSSALACLALCEAAAEHATVFLSGDGGDEAFAGYGRHVEALRLARLTRLPGWVRGACAVAAVTLPALSASRYRLAKLALPDQLLAGAFDGIPTDPALDLVVHPRWRPALQRARARARQRWAETTSPSLTCRQQRQDHASYLPDDILVKMDRASMASSIEVRSPLLDHRLVEWAARLPRGALLDTRQGKLPLRALAARRLPPAVAGARKRGFGVPLDAWFRTEAGQAMVRDRLLEDTALARGLWSARGVERAARAHRDRSGRPVGMLLWRLLALDAWARCYLDGDAFLDGPAPSSAAHPLTTADRW